MSELAADSTTEAIDLPRNLRMLAVLLGALLAVFLSRLLIDILYIRDGRSTNDVMVFVVLPGVYLILLVGLPFVLVRRARHLAAFDCIWFRRGRSEFVRAWLMPVGVIAIIAATALLVYQFRLPVSRSITCGRDYSNQWKAGLLVWSTVVAVLVGPFAEEVFWRGYVQSTLVRLVHPAVAIVGQAVLFGLIHFDPVVGFMQDSLFGLILGIWCYRRRTLLPVIIMHMAINGVARTADWVDWSELRQVKVTHDYVAEFLEFSKPALYDPNDDARKEYTKACQLVADLPTELDGMQWTYPTQWDEGKRAQAQAWVGSNAEALGVLEEGTRKATYWPEYEFQDGMLPAFAPHLKEIKQLVFALSVRAKLSAIEGRHDDAFADVLTCCRLAEHLSRCKDTITYLVAMAVRGVTAQTVRLILDGEQIDSASLTQWQQEFEGFAARNDLVLDFTAERLWMLDAVQRLFTDEGRSSGQIPRCVFRPGRSVPLGFSDIGKMTRSDIEKWKRLDRRRTAEALHEYYRAFGRVTALSPWEYERNVEGVKEALKKIASENILVRTFSPTTRIGHMMARARVDIDSLVAILAILRYRVDRGQLPESLDTLVAEGYLGSVPRDPYGPGALTYKRLNDDFVLYSHGADFDDDRGTPSKWGTGPGGGDQVFWPVVAGE